MQTAKERILLVDDEPQVLIALEDLLGDDFSVLKTASPEEALLIVEQDHGIAVVVSDQRMPKMTGDELLARLALVCDARKILVTAFADLSAVIRAVNNGKIFAYVTKPWNAEDLVLKVRKAAEHFRLAQELARERRLLDCILNSLGEGIVAVDRDGRCLLFNAQAEKILGHGPRPVSPETWARDYGVFASDRTQPLSAQDNPLLRAMSGERAPDVEAFVRNERVRGSVVAISGTPLGGGYNDVHGGVAVLRDVTQQRDLEVQLRQSQKMDAIGRLAGGVAHDFNNLLVVIQSYAELIREDLPAENPAREDLDEVLAATRRASALTKQLLAFSRSEPVQPVDLRLSEVVGGIEKMLRRIIGEDIELFIELSPSPGVVRADPGQLDQVILNLVVNARDAMPNGGQLTIATQNVTLDAEDVDAHPSLSPGEFVMLAVTDTGTGMDVETQRRIFEPFFTTKEQGKGTGLGLASVYGIVQQSGAAIEVDTQLGRGTAFHLDFARSAAPAPEPSRPLPVAPGLTAPRTVLVVEDEVSVAKLVRRVLENAGITVLLAHDAEAAEALALAHPGRIDLLLTDVVMPKTSGRVLADRLTRRFPTLVVLFMSGFAGDSLEPDGVTDSALLFLHKPFTPDVLQARVFEALSSAVLLP